MKDTTQQTAQHTPGPLKVTRETERHIETIRDEKGRWLADVVAGQGVLLAAAPELLECCQKVVARWTPETGKQLERLLGTHFVNQISAAIARATGNQGGN